MPQTIILIAVALICIVFGVLILLTQIHTLGQLMDTNRSSWKPVVDGQLPMDRVAVVYDTHDDRQYRFAFGHFQFHEGKLQGFFKDGNEQPKRIKAKDLLYWMELPSLPK